MIYKFLNTNMDGVKIYAKIDDDGISRQSCTEFDQAFKKAVLEGAQLLDADGNVISADFVKDLV